jgi:recombination protein RecT
MANDLAVIEHQLKSIRPRLDSALGGIMPATRLEQTILVSCERIPKLLQCSPQSVLNAAMTFAVLGLPVDGATGQGFLLPFWNKEDRVYVCQAIIGYKGYNTLGARAGLTITAGTVRENDEMWDYELGSAGFVRHRPRLGSTARIVAFWSCATALDRPPIISILSIEDVLAIKEKSRAAEGGGGPWHDPKIGFPAMGEKSARRRLSRSTPLRIDQPQFAQAARMEEAVDEQGKLSWITPDRGVVVEGEPASKILPSRNEETPSAESLVGATQADSREVAPVGDQVESFPGDIEKALKDAAEKGGLAALKTAWENLTEVEQSVWRTRLDNHFKPLARQWDKRHVKRKGSV